MSSWCGSQGPNSPRPVAPARVPAPAAPDATPAVVPPSLPPTTAWTAWWAPATWTEPPRSCGAPSKRSCKPTLPVWIFLQKWITARVYMTDRYGRIDFSLWSGNNRMFFFYFHRCFHPLVWFPHRGQKVARLHQIEIICIQRKQLPLSLLFAHFYQLIDCSQLLAVGSWDEKRCVVFFVERRKSIAVKSVLPIKWVDCDQFHFFQQRLRACSSTSTST